MLFLDAQNRLIAMEELFRGTLTQTSVYPREVVQRALQHDAASVVLAHNHPSGTVQPSRADEALTQTLKAALALVDVRVLDHVIVAPGRCAVDGGEGPDLRAGHEVQVAQGPAAHPASSWREQQQAGGGAGGRAPGGGTPRPRRARPFRARGRRRATACGTHRRVHLAPEQPPPIAVQQQLDDQRVLQEAISDEFDAATLLDIDDALSFRRPGIGTDVTRKLRKGDWSIQGEIDLHGLRREDAREALAEFMRDAHRRGLRCVRVVHGKGLGSPGKTPVLKGKVQSWLIQKNEVLAFVQARGDEGGAGALVVLLKPSPV